MYNVDSWMVDGKPGTGNTPIEKFLAMVFACWYLASILPVILSYLSGSTRGLQFAILGPLFYHLLISINSFLYLQEVGVLNDELNSANVVGMVHAFLGIVCLVLFKS